ncbi:effector binding domain-containing protein [Enterococcus mediterraneensis]|uniref:effector binding domain-containing protein n=1 Tax=Enterococcus mediterraneensis TaxID=2364791 RepID=UPI0013DFE9E9|nr:effector binding domain-containing protein [Enterococcus mediterraneensis]
MSFTLKNLNAMTITGVSTTLEVPNSQDGFRKLTEDKQVLRKKFLSEKDTLEKNAQDDQIYGVNFNNEQQNYLVGVQASSDSFTTFEIKAGTYAFFEAEEIAEEQIDAFIGQSYGEIGASEKVAIAGNFNLEILTGLFTGKNTFAIYIPVVEK